MKSRLFTGYLLIHRKCALLDVSRQCHYRMKLGDQDTWYNISQMCRNRVSENYKIPLRYFKSEPCFDS